MDEVETSSQISLIHPPHMLNKLLPYSNATGTLFFQEEASSDKLRGGAAALVSRALTNTDYSLHLVNPRDAYCHMKVANFVLDLTHNQRIQFAELIKLTCNISSNNNSDVSIDGFTCNNEIIKSSLPSTFNFIENTYIRGKYSILDNIPYPVVHNVEGRGYVSLLNIIFHLLSSSNKYTAAHIKDYVTEACEGVGVVVTVLSQSRAVQNLIERAAAVCGDEEVILLMC